MVDNETKAPNSINIMNKENKIKLLLLSHFSRVQLCATPWTAAHQAPLSMEFSRQESLSE